MDKKSMEVVGHITAYFEKYLPDYIVLGIGRKSYHPDDAHLYMVLSKKKDGNYGFYDCWDDAKKILHRKRYGIEFLDSFAELLNERQNNATYYAVYACTDGAKGLLFITEDEEKARKFCENQNWKWEDDYGEAYRLIYEVTR